MGLIRARAGGSGLGTSWWSVTMTSIPNSEAALIASLEQADALLERVQVIVDERDRMFRLLDDMPGVSPWPSYGNFILCSFAPGVAGTVYDGLAARGIFVRRFSTERLADTFRITVGSRAETDAVIAAMRELVSQS